MAQHSKPPPVLLPRVAELLTAHRSAFRQERTFQRLSGLVIGLICAFSRHTLTQVLVALGLGEQDWSAAYRLFSVPRVDYAVLTRCLLRQTLAHVPADQPYLVAIDGVQVPRRSRTMPGTSWLHDAQSPPFRRGIHRAQRYLHLAWLTPPTAAGDSRALPLRWQLAAPEKAVRPAGMAAQREWEAGQASLAWLRAELDAAGRQAQPVLAVADGAYSSQGTWRGLPERTSLLARCAQNRALFALPAPRPAAGAGQGRGRRRSLTVAARPPRAWLAERSGWTTTRLTVRGRLVPCTYRVAGPYLVKGAPNQPLFLLVVRGLDRVRRGHRRQRRPAFWLVSATRSGPDGPWAVPWPPAQLLAWAWQRWEIEVTHRELKCGFGIGEGQCWNPVAAVLSVQWRVWVWSILALAGYRAWGLGRDPLPPLGRWWQGSRRWSFGQLWQGFRQELWAQQDFRPVWTGTPATWTEILAQPATWTNASLGARRG